MTLSEMRRLMDSQGIRLTRSLGQNFLHDAQQLRRIVACAALGANDRVLEIGPGLGPLTELLLESAGEVVAIEIDERLTQILKDRFSETQLELIHADALGWLRSNERDWSGWKLVANLPYSVGSPILVELAQSAKPPDRLVVTVQTEVGERIAARSGTADYGVLTLLLAERYEVRQSFVIPRGCFFPVPNVDSTCVVLHRRERPLVAEAFRKAYVRAVKLGFGQRRKMLHKLLRAAWSRDAIDAAFERLGLDAGIRGERLSPEQFALLAESLEASASGS